jgi:hypothetical protein
MINARCLKILLAVREMLGNVISTMECMEVFVPTRGGVFVLTRDEQLKMYPLQVSDVWRGYHMTRSFGILFVTWLNQSGYGRRVIQLEWGNFKFAGETV